MLLGVHTLDFYLLLQSNKIFYLIESDSICRNVYSWLIPLEIIKYIRFLEQMNLEPIKLLSASLKLYNKNISVKPYNI